MRKNKTMRVATALLTLAMATTCFVGGTFAKYTTGDDAKASARVAKWGVNVEVTGDDMFRTGYMNKDGQLTVQTCDDSNIVAPGTNGKGVTIKVTGTPEVASKLTFDCSGHDIYMNDYHPVQFQLWGGFDPSSPVVRPIVTGSLEEVLQALNDKSKTYEPNEEINETYQLSWSWAFDGKNTDDELDTELGNWAAMGLQAGKGFSTQLDYAINVTVEQVD